MIRAEGIGVFGDVRRAERGAWLFERIVATGSLVLRTVGGNRAGEIASHRFLDSPRVSAAEIVGTLGRRTGELCRGRRIIAVQDTTEINFSGRDRARCGLGPAGDGKTPGFFIHAAVAVDAEDEAVVGSGWGRAAPATRGAPPWSVCGPAPSALPDRAMASISAIPNSSI